MQATPEWERWDEENTADKSLEDLIFQRDLAQASIESGDYPSLHGHWQQDVADLNQLIAKRQQQS
jgi:hypothetical protein